MLTTRQPTSWQADITTFDWPKCIVIGIFYHFTCGNYFFNNTNSDQKVQWTCQYFLNIFTQVISLLVLKQHVTHLKFQISNKPLQRDLEKYNFVIKNFTAFSFAIYPYQNLFLILQIILGRKLSHWNLNGFNYKLYVWEFLSTFNFSPVVTFFYHQDFMADQHHSLWLNSFFC